MSTKKIFWLIFTFIIIFFVILVQSAPLIRSGHFDASGNLIFKDFVVTRDSFVHLALINELGNRFPPTNFAAGGVPLKNYHYLFDLSLAMVLKILPISRVNLYFHLLPIVLSAGLCLVIFLTTRKLIGNKFYASLAIFFGILGASMGQIMPQIKIFLHANTVTGGSDMFMTDQIINMMINPQGVLSLIIYLSLFLLLDNFARTKKSIALIIYALLLGLSFGVKAYGGIVFAQAGLVFALYYFFVKKDWRPLSATLAGILLIALWFKATIDGKVAGLNFAPFWLLDAMYEDITRLNEPALPFLKSTHAYLGNWHHVIRLTVEQLLAYILGSLGPKILGILGTIYLLKHFKKQSPALVFLLAAAIVSFVIPLLFNQSKKAHDIVQFTPYFTLFMGISFTIALYAISKKLKNGILMGGIILFFAGLFLFLNSRDIIGKLEVSTQDVIFTPEILAGLNFLQTKTDKNAMVLLAVNNFNKDYLFVPALSGRRTVYSGERFAFQVGVDTQMLESRLKNLPESGNCPISFDYIFATRDETGFSDKIRRLCETEAVFENDEVTIFRHHR